MGKMIIPKNTASVDEVIGAMQIYYDANNWVTNAVFIQEYKNRYGIIGDDTDSSAYTKKTEIGAYYGFIEWEDIKNKKSSRRITQRGKIFLEHYLANDTVAMHEDIMCSLEEVEFGRNNFACCSCDSDIEPPSVFLRAMIDLEYLTNSEFAYLIYKMEYEWQHYTDLILEIRRYRNDDISLIIPKEANKFKDPKPILILERLGVLEGTRMGTNKAIKISTPFFAKYKKRLKALKIFNIDKTPIENNRFEEKITSEIYKYTLLKTSQNLIFFGAPGTGKSYELNKEAKENFGNNIERVTFYPNYSYAQFVGTYKPVMTQTQDNKEEITYTYVPGPFIRQWIRAINSPDDKFLLIIEELNRANAPAVFGDMFQLLDRENGQSVYDVATSEDLRRYLRNLPKTENEAPDGSKWEWLPEGTNVDVIKIPSNMYIWTTMNSADQGVFPLDTAFKRRWDYKYFSVWEHKDIDDNIVVINNKKYTWGDIREAINNKLADKNVNEDKFIGPYFLSTSVFDESDDYKAFKNAFKDKVLMYLFEDAARQYKKDIFKTDGKAAIYSKIVESFETKGFDIFQFEINEAKEPEKEVISEED